MFSKCLTLCHQTVLISKAEGEFKVSDLIRRGQSLCQHEDLEQSGKQEIQELVRQTEEQWKTALQAANEALRKVEAQTLLDQDLLSFKTLDEQVQSWISEQEQNLQSGGGLIQLEEKLQIAQVSFRLCVNHFRVSYDCILFFFLKSFFFKEIFVVSRPL